MNRRTALIVIASFAFTFSSSRADDLKNGLGRLEFKDGSTKIDLFTYRPAKFDEKSGRLLIVFHGVNRNAEEYRDWAKSLGDATGSVVVAPRFDKESFPTSAYQQGNLLKEKQARPKADWTWSRIPKIADFVRQQLGRTDMPFDLIGHSAGGQFLGRSAGFLDTGATRIVAANSGTYLAPTREFDYPLGFGKLPAELSSDAAINAYLARPLTLFLGTGYTVADENFDKSPAAMKQGGSRYERGKFIYETGRKLAADRQVKFGWRLIEAEGIGHVAKSMFSHPNARLALREPTQ